MDKFAEIMLLLMGVIGSICLLFLVMMAYSLMGLL